MKLDEAWLACCAVWWFLFFHGIKADLSLFSKTHLNIHVRMYPITQWWRRLRLSLKRGSNELKNLEREYYSGVQVLVSDGNPEIGVLSNLPEQDKEDIPF